MEAAELSSWAEGLSSRIPTVEPEGQAEGPGPWQSTVTQVLQRIGDQSHRADIYPNCTSETTEQSPILVTPSLSEDQNLRES